MLFTEDSKQTATINGEQHIVFKPNTIIYAVPSDNDLAKDIESAKLGIVFHTEYVGNSMAEMNARFGYDASGLGQSKDVWYRDAIIKDYSGQVTMTKEESELLRGLIETANKNLSQVSDLEFLRNNEFGEDLRTRIKASVNKIIRDILIGALGVVLTLAAYPLVGFLLAPLFNELVTIIIFGSFVAIVGGFIWTFFEQANIDYKKTGKRISFLSILYPFLGFLGIYLFFKFSISPMIIVYVIGSYLVVSLIISLIGVMKDR